jgi:hypothetical protein
LIDRFIDAIHFELNCHDASVQRYPCTPALVCIAVTLNKKSSRKKRFGVLLAAAGEGTILAG